MRKNTLILCRGLPGSGKSSLARTLAPNANFAADDFFEIGGEYHFDPHLLGDAHHECQRRVKGAMKAEEPVIAVHNTFSRAWEADAYFAMAEVYGYSVFVVEAQNDYGNIHDVPERTIEAMRAQWEPLQREELPLWKELRRRWRKFWKG